MSTIVDKTKGRIKQAVGALIGDSELKREGERDEMKGKVDAAIQGVKDAAKDAATAVKNGTNAVKEVVK